MGSIFCPRCESRVSTTSCPSDHTGYFLSDHMLEILEVKNFESYSAFFDWFEENCEEANRCPYCGYIWTFDPQGDPGYSREFVNVQKWKPEPMLKYICTTHWCADKGSYIRRTKSTFDKEPVSCETCHHPFTLEERKDG